MVTSFGRVAASGKLVLELNKAPGLWDSQAPGREVSRAFMGRLMYGPHPLGVSGQKVGPAFLGWLVAGPLRILSQLAIGVGPGFKVPTMPPFFYRGSESSLVGKK